MPSASNTSNAVIYVSHKEIFSGACSGGGLTDPFADPFADEEETVSTPGIHERSGMVWH